MHIKVDTKGTLATSTITLIDGENVQVVEGQQIAALNFSIFPGFNRSIMQAVYINDEGKQAIVELKANDTLMFDLKVAREGYEIEIFGTDKPEHTTYSLKSTVVPSHIQLPIGLLQAAVMADGTMFAHQSYAGITDPATGKELAHASH